MLVSIAATAFAVSSACNVVRQVTGAFDAPEASGDSRNSTVKKSVFANAFSRMGCASAFTFFAVGVDDFLSPASIFVTLKLPSRYPKRVRSF